jgi:hypothetical protein
MVQLILLRTVVEPDDPTVIPQGAASTRLGANKSIEDAIEADANITPNRYHRVLIRFLEANCFTMMDLKSES